MRLKYKKEIAAEYGFCLRTLTNKLKAYDIKIKRGLISLEMQKVIYEVLGYPPGVVEKDFEGVKELDDKYFEKTEEVLGN